MISDNLLATSPTLERLHSSIGRFYCGMETRLDPAGADEWRVIRACDGKHLDGVTVRKARNRYRFEMVTP